MPVCSLSRVAGFRLLPFVATLFVVGSLGMSAVAAEAVGESWPGWRGKNRDNISQSTGLSHDWEKTPPELSWKLEGMGSGYASVSIDNDKLYTTGNTDKGQVVVAVDLASHKILWTAPLTTFKPEHGYDGSRCTPAIDGEFLYAVASSGAIVCLKTETGEEVWRKDFNKDFGGKMMSGWGFSESPLVDGDRVVCTPGGPEAMLVALNKKTGETEWKTPVGELGPAGATCSGYSSVVISEAAGVKQYVQLVGRGVIGVRASDGKLLWSYNRVANPVANIPTPIVSGNYVFASSGYSEGGTALLEIVKKGTNFDAKEIYYKPASALQNHHGGMVFLNGHVYMGNAHNNGFPTCIKMKSGDVAWGGKIRGPGEGSAAITMADGHLIFRYQSGEVALIEATPKKYKLKGSFRPEVVEREGWAQPVVVGKKLYLREQNTLMCYDIGVGR